jgi:Ala-tRNA(Pro) deacylase
MNSASVLASIRSLLSGHNISYREVHHEPTSTSEESARARGESLRIGGKAILMKCGDRYALFVLPADRKVDSTAIRKHLSLKRLRFATAEELIEYTGLVPGSVPPFGRPILPFDVYLDEAIQANDRIAFNAGSLTDSIILATTDYLEIVNARDCFSFSIPLATDS